MCVYVSFVRSNKKTPSPSPTVSVPYSGPVNLLKALNYTTRRTLNGLYVPQHQSSQNASKDTTPNKISSIAAKQEMNVGHMTSQVTAHVQKLAEAYSQEMSGVSNQNNCYKLVSVVVHLGDVSSGHFVTYRRVPSTDGQRFPAKWLYTSDTHVRKASRKEVMGADAYMLFYEKI